MPKSRSSLCVTDQLSFLVEKIVTSGHSAPDVDHVRQLCGALCKDISLVDPCSRLLLLQLDREHSQIRLGVVMLLANLARPSFYLDHITEPTLRPVSIALCTAFRISVLTHIQRWSDRVLGISSNRKPIPMPLDAAKQSVRCFLNLILDWDLDVAKGVFDARAANNARNTSPCKLSSLARGQLKSYLTYLHNTTHLCRFQSTAKHVESLRLRDLFVQVQTERASEAAAAENESRLRCRRVRKCLKQIESLREHIEENLCALESSLQLLVPDPFASGPNNHNHDPLTAPACSYDRLHGRLYGTSSGLSLHTGNIDVTLSCTPGSSYVTVPISRTEDTRALEDTARENAHLARDKYKRRMTQWLEELNIDLSNINLPLHQRACSQADQLRQWLTRSDRLTHLFFDRLVFVDDSGDNEEMVHHSALPSGVDPSDSSSSESSDFEDVSHSPITDAHEDPFPTQSTSDSVVDQPAKSSSLTNETIVSTCELIPDKSSVVWRAKESLHRFWRPNEPEDYEIPKDYLALALSDKLDETQSAHKQPDRDEIPSTDDIETGLETASSKPPLACWAPLPSGKLCRRRDVGGHCPLHGRVVKRDALNGRPVDPKDREALLEELTARKQAREQALAAQVKRAARRRYPGLMAINKPLATARNRLLKRVCSNRAMKTLIKTLDSYDQRVISSRFSDNYIHAVKPK